MTSILPKPGTETARLDAPGGAGPGWKVFAEGVRIIALRALGDPTLAEDIAQESVARALAALASDRADAVADLGAFVYGIARHIIADVHRSGGRTVPIDTVSEPTAPHVDALDAVISGEEATQVREAVSKLPAGDRDLLRLYFVDGLDAEEVAARLREPVVNVRKRKSRALDRLRRIFLACHKERPSTTGTT